MLALGGVNIGYRCHPGLLCRFLLPKCFNELGEKVYLKE